MGINDKLQKEFGEIFITVGAAVGAPERTFLHEKGKRAYLSADDLIGRIFNELGPFYVPHLIVYPGKALPENIGRGALHLQERELYIAVDAPDIQNQLHQFLERYVSSTATHEVLAQTGHRRIRPKDRIPKARGTRSGETRTGFEGGREPRERFDPSVGPDSSKRIKNTRGDFMHFRNAPEEESEFWIKYIFSNLEQYAPNALLRTLRVVNGLSLEEMASKLELGVSTYNHYENSDDPLPLKHCITILDNNLFDLPTASYDDRNHGAYEAVAPEYSNPFLRKFGYQTGLFPEARKTQVFSALHASLDAVKKSELPSDVLPTVREVTRYLLRGDTGGDITDDKKWQNMIRAGLANPINEASLYPSLQMIAEKKGWNDEQRALVAQLPHKTKSGKMKLSSDFAFTPEACVKMAREKATSIGEYLYLYRTNIGLSQTDVALKAGVAQVNIGRWEKKKALGKDIMDNVKRNNPYRFPIEDGEIIQAVIDDLNRLNTPVKKPGSGKSK